MKAAIVPEPGAAASYGDFDDPVAADGGELVELVASGIHPQVRSLAGGRQDRGPVRWPLIPGVDAVARAAGTLVLTGYPEPPKPPYGTLAEQIPVPGGMRVPLPAGSDPVSIAGGLNPGLASWLPLTARIRETGALGGVLVLGVTRTEGLLATQNAFVLGATRVIGAGRNPAGLARASAAGAVTVPLTGDAGQDAGALAAALDGQAPGLVLDFLWAEPTEAAFAALDRPGLGADPADTAYEAIGAVAGPDAAMPASLLRTRRIHLPGSSTGSVSAAVVLAELTRYMELIAAGRVQVPTRTFPLSRVADAWAAAASGARRAVVIPG
jgi:NADPH:quinone reductase-like Zn-dependent oxidoreductase